VFLVTQLPVGYCRLIPFLMPLYLIGPVGPFVAASLFLWLFVGLVLFSAKLILARRGFCTTLASFAWIAAWLDLAAVVHPLCISLITEKAPWFVIVLLGLIFLNLIQDRNHHQ